MTKLSVVIPSHNEADCIKETIESTHSELALSGIDHELIVVDDNSTDDTARIVNSIAEDNCVVYIKSPLENGFGLTVRAGLEVFSGDFVAVMMADLSDSPKDLVTYYNLLNEGYDCVFGSRFVKGSNITDYPLTKKIINRIVNTAINLIFGLGYNDTTNAFKAYRREVIESVQPILSHHFNLTVELPLKAVVRGSNYAVVPISWTNRKTGESKLKLKEMGSRYLFMVLSVFLERHLTKSDYRRKDFQSTSVIKGE